MRQRAILLAGGSERIRDQIDRLFDQLLVKDLEHAANQPHTWSPPMDVFETDDFYLVRLEIAGMNKDDFEIIFQDHVLYIKGVRRESDVPHRLYHQMQIRYGGFLSVVRFGDDIDVDGIDAEYQAGFLTVRLPKRTSTVSVSKQSRRGGKDE